MKYLHTILMEKSENKGPHGRSRPRWKDNIKIDYQEIEWEGMDWMGLSLDVDRW